MNGEGEEAAGIIRASANLPYDVGIVLGSGLGGVADHVEEAVRIPYSALPNFPASTVSSHRNEVVCGWLDNVAVAVLSGRVHFYETGNPAAMREPIACLKALGCRILLLTNAAGSLRTEVGPGEVMLVTDHIAFSGINPLIGQRSDDRFVSLTNAYDPDLRADLFAAAEHEGVALSSGVYIWFSGPSFETPAEIRMARLAGAHAVGMSTVPEVILGRFFGLRCAAISAIVHFAAGMTGYDITHEETKRLAPIGAAKVERIVRRFLRDGRWK